MDIRAGKILLVDDEEQIRNYLVQTLNMRGCSVLPFATGDEALSAFMSLRAEGCQPPVAIIDNKLVGSTITGLGIVRKIREVDKDCILILMSGDDLADESKLAAGFSVDAFLQKPLTGEELMAHIRTAMEKRTRPIEECQPVKSKSDMDVTFKKALAIILVLLAGYLIFEARLNGKLESDVQTLIRQNHDTQEYNDTLVAHIQVLQKLMTQSHISDVPPIPARPSRAQEKQ